MLAADLGGTKITVSLVTAGGEVRGRRTVPTRAQRGPDAILADLAAALSAVLEEATADPAAGSDAPSGPTAGEDPDAGEDSAAGKPGPIGIGIGSAGVVDPGTGRITAATDAIPGWTGTELATRVADLVGLPARALNDVHAHALGEDQYGAGAGTSSLLMVAVGTGIGGAVVQNGQVLFGARAAGGNVGHLPVPEADGVPCPCGRTGHLEGLGSGPGVLSAYRRAGGEAADTREVVARAQAGEPRALMTLRTCAGAVGRVIGGLLNVIDPEVVVLSGGMAGAGELWWEAVRDGVAHDAMDIVAATPLLPATAGPDAALLGAAHFARTHLG